MTGRTRVLWWGLAAIGATVAAGLLTWVTAADLERSSQIAGVVGTVVGIAALGVALWQLKTSTASPPPTAPSAAPVRAESGSNAAGGNIRNAQARDTAPGPSTSSGGSGIVASGGSNAAGGDIDGSTAQHGR
ncbi:hypothetical protein [Streptomyces sp. NEAU-S7GS2]|uniref:hypothetical protein n=1 Tax=Streptomyces sp. NEAU-S7GS2 TaxID=2202000 RepID=UPI0013A594C3|nr:hypothetical protein [Streptomyces sp. NEAU-S7GS2]